MRQLSAAALAALNLDNPTFFILAKIEFSTILRATSLPYDVVFNGATYLSSNPIYSFGPPRVSSSVDREVYELAMLDHDNSYQTFARSGVTGSLLTIYAGFLDSSKQPLLGTNDVFVAYQGYVDSCKVANDGSSKLFLIRASSPMGNLDASGGYIASKDGMDQVNTADTSFDDIYSGGRSVSLKWGKS